MPSRGKPPVRTLTRLWTETDASAILEGIAGLAAFTLILGAFYTIIVLPILHKDRTSHYAHQLATHAGANPGPAPDTDALQRRMCAGLNTILGTTGTDCPPGWILETYLYTNAEDMRDRIIMPVDPDAPLPEWPANAWIEVELKSPHTSRPYSALRPKL